MVYFQILHNILRDPMKRALEKQAMELTGTPGHENELPPFLRQIFDRGEVQGEARGKREALLRLLSRMGISITPEERARIDECTDLPTLDRWFDNAIGARAATDVFH